MLSLPLEQADARFEHEAMNCLFTFVLAGAESSYLGQAAMAAAACVDALEDRLSLYREHSEVARINAARAGETVRISEETVACLETALRISAATGSAFHPFCGRPSMVAKEQLPPFAGAPPSVGPDPVIALDPTACAVRKLRAGPLLDLGGIGKGFALDEARRLLVEEWEVPAGLLVAGGSSVLGYGPRGADPWPVGLSGNFTTRGLDNAALASSGLGFQPRHIIDPATGGPVAVARRVTVHARHAAEADALATAAMVLPRERIESFFVLLEGVSLLLEEDKSYYPYGDFFTLTDSD